MEKKILYSILCALGGGMIGFFANKLSEVYGIILFTLGNNFLKQINAVVDIRASLKINKTEIPCMISSLGKRAISQLTGDKKEFSIQELITLPPAPKFQSTIKLHFPW